MGEVGGLLEILAAPPSVFSLPLHCDWAKK